MCASKHALTTTQEDEKHMLVLFKTYRKSHDAIWQTTNKSNRVRCRRNSVKFWTSALFLSVSLVRLRFLDNSANKKNLFIISNSCPISVYVKQNRTHTHWETAVPHGFRVKQTKWENATTTTALKSYPIHVKWNYKSRKERTKNRCGNEGRRKKNTLFRWQICEMKTRRQIVPLCATYMNGVALNGERERHLRTTRLHDRSRLNYENECISVPWRSRSE